MLVQYQGLKCVQGLHPSTVEAVPFQWWAGNMVENQSEFASSSYLRVHRGCQAPAGLWQHIASVPLWVCCSSAELGTTLSFLVSRITIRKHCRPAPLNTQGRVVPKVLREEAGTGNWVSGCLPLTFLLSGLVGGLCSVFQSWSLSWRHAVHSLPRSCWNEHRLINTITARKLFNCFSLFIVTSPFYFQSLYKSFSLK